MRWPEPLHVRRLRGLMTASRCSATTCVQINTIRAARHYVHLITGDDLLEAVTLMEDVVQRRRRVFGPAHPQTRNSEAALCVMRNQRVDSA